MGAKQYSLDDFGAHSTRKFMLGTLNVAKPPLLWRPHVLVGDLLLQFSLLVFIYQCEYVVKLALSFFFKSKAIYKNTQ